MNPLGLTPRPGLNEPPLENLRLDPFFPTSKTFGEDEFRNISETGDRFRKRRDIEMIVKSEAYTDKDGTKHQIVNMVKYKLFKLNIMLNYHLINYFYTELSTRNS